jgi:L,D-transpeptidase ErfK/SrfK
MLVATNPWQGGRNAAPQSDLIGEAKSYVTTSEDTLVEIAQRFGVGFIELRAANQYVNAWLPGERTPLTLPTMHVIPEGPRQGIVINLADMRLYHFKRNGQIESYPVGLGQEGWETPLGVTTIVGKRENPSWFPPPSIRQERPDLPTMVGPGPNNPLGSRALYLGLDAYLVHGTNLPAGVGRYLSHGCIRMYEQHVQKLYAETDIGTSVAIIYQPVKVGWSDGQLYLEVSPTRDQAAEIEILGDFTPAVELGVEERILDVGGEIDAVDWDVVGRAVRERRGVPVRISSYQHNS